MGGKAEVLISRLKNHLFFKCIGLSIFQDTIQDIIRIMLRLCTSEGKFTIKQRIIILQILVF